MKTEMTITLHMHKNCARWNIKTPAGSIVAWGQAESPDEAAAWVAEALNDLLTNWISMNVAQSEEA